MNAKNLMASFSLILLLCVLLNLAIVQVNANENNKIKGGKVPPPSVPTGNNSDNNVPKKDGGENNPPPDAENALQELKNFTKNLEKKTTTNRNIIISTTVINMVLLVLLSGLIGYNTKKGFKKGQMGSVKEVTPEAQKGKL
ncbi:sexual stage antigen s16, putative [Plasmodium vivax]|uniref:Sexual stage antigen s16, putative n=6 Tax=Plasmodium vivax TaxID=5855 RepID=A5KAN3_PLAVS|nr:sexual stage antigen s16, putative [Plasmodium vivax]KMZ82621.1 hypothetical protein PVIIG_02411 [Plasmodium vivax India VII]KMZ89015.1 hypothetical protein PVBG_02985 [Plasmodium vivax Brazil I]KMZ95426.1 hypothetical protein PVMG_04772 [Plasmodium vivax Mauritania I]KNA01905.1 hypothetical protein PVNG_02978 [Plasmodium vivax North Korean]EDL43632.1 sexual stage antigen s16, putative [Plasmodium vivax]|eukprot:XP_001613359.1 sexual stage antigen s16 [Plasmodium vivax Sal-1]